MQKQNKYSSRGRLTDSSKMNQKHTCLRFVLREQLPGGGVVKIKDLVSFRHSKRFEVILIQISNIKVSLRGKIGYFQSQLCITQVSFKSHLLKYFRLSSWPVSTPFPPGGTTFFYIVLCVF